MQRSQLIAFDLEGRLAEVVQELALSRALWLREARHLKTCLNFLRKGGAEVLVIYLGKDQERALTLMEQVAHLFPQTQTIAVSSTDNSALEALAWDLGAAYVLFPPQPIERIREVLIGFLPALPGNG